MPATKKSRSRKSRSSAKPAKSKKSAKSKSSPPKRRVRPTSSPAVLQETYSNLQKILSLYAPPLLLSSTAAPKPCTRLTIPRPVVIPGIYSGKPIHLEIASFLPQKDSVSFHFLPLYMDPTLKSKLSPGLLKTLKGKTCFHIKSLDSSMVEHINTAIEVGASFYRSRGWL